MENYGYGTCYEVVSIVRTFHKSKHFMKENYQNAWKTVKFCVFDAPDFTGSILERYSHLQKLKLQEISKFLALVPIEHCTSKDNMINTLFNIVKKGGEGIMLYHPQALYTSGRTPFVRKVKNYEEEYVKFIDLAPNNYNFICELKNGDKCTVRCTAHEYKNFPEKGTVLTVRHLGMHKTSKKLKFPFFIRASNDIQWDNIVTM